MKGTGFHGIPRALNGLGHPLGVLWHQGPGLGGGSVTGS